MAATITYSHANSGFYGQKLHPQGTGNLGTYAANGLAVTPAQFGLGAIDKLQFDRDDTSKYTFQYIPSTGKIKAFVKPGLQANTPLIVEEAVTIASNVGTLSNVPAYIISVNASAGGTTGACAVIPSGKSPLTTNCAVNFLTGGLTFFSTDAVTAALVTYIPLGIGPFIESNRVVDEAVTLATAGVNLASQAALVQYVYDDSATTTKKVVKIVPVDESAAADGQMKLDIINTAATTITPHAAMDTHSALVTYWKKSAFGAEFGFTDQADIAATSNAIAVSVLAGKGYFIPSYGVQYSAEDGATNHHGLFIGPSGAAAADVAKYDMIKQTVTFDAGDSIDTLNTAYLLIDSTYTKRPSAPIEVSAGVDLSGVTFNWFAEGA